MILIIDCGSRKTKYIEEIIDEFYDFERILGFYFPRLKYLSN
jgi:hypothetical protein